MDNTETIISFCTGYGGIELGLRMAGVRVREVAYVEIEAYAAANLVEKIEAGEVAAAPVWTDIKTFPAKAFHGKVHGVTAGYPCQPFSNAGKRRGADDERRLWPYIAEHIGAVRPVWCFLENVAGHLDLGFREVFKSLRDMGYSVEAGLFTAAEVGAPHERKRLFVLAYDSGVGFCRRLPRGAGADDSEWIQEGKPHRNRLRRKTARCGGKLSGRGELAYTRESEPGGLPGDERQAVSEVGGGGELGDATIQRQYRGGENGREQPSEMPGARLESVGDARTDGPQGCGGNGNGEGQAGLYGGAGYPQARWPARPGEEQYDWEEPRTVESGVGCTVDGYQARVDMLRLAGNGVVPQQAAKAWICLWEKMRRNFEV